MPALVKNANGLSLVELSISMFILGVMGVMTMKLIDNQIQGEALLRSSSEVSKTMSLLKTAINDRSRCYDMVGGRSFSAAGESIDTLSYFDRDKDQAGAVAKEFLGSGKSYKEFQIPGQLAPPDKSGIFIKKSTLGPDLADLTITFKINKKGLSFLSDSNTLPFITVKRTISFVVSRTAVGAPTITGCGPAVGDANDIAKRNLCKQFGFTWDIPTSKCTPPTPILCAAETVPKGVVAFDQLDCVPVRNWINLDDYFDYGWENCTTKAPAGTWNKITMVVEGGKYRMRCSNL
ncbi:MAG TPA: hypothetical protein VNJ01_05810 [Bacteriovoracaceae bacterium]|nr:hypothetical protein [Bacteriovoracaceae bacterium]